MRILLTTLLLGCTATGSATGTSGVHYASSAPPPQMVEIEPEVQVIADYEEPVFYTDNTYWLYRGGGWYSSRDYRSGWVSVQAPPPRIRRIERPEIYVRYRGRAGVGPRDHRDGGHRGPEVRDHRGGDHRPGPGYSDEDRRKYEINAQRQREADAEAKRKHDINAQRQRDADAEAKRKHDINAQRQRDADAEAKRKHDINAQRAAQQQADAEAKRKHAINKQRAEQEEAEAKRKHEINKQRAQQK